MRIAVVLAAGLVFWAIDAEACSCRWASEGRKGAEELLESSDAIFRGRMVQAKVYPAGIVFTFEVSKAWKGSASSVLEVQTPRYSDECGIEAEVGTEHIVYADWVTVRDGTPRFLFTTVCDGTNTVEFMQSRFPERLAFLEEMPDLRQPRDLQAQRRGGCAGCTATGPGLSILPLLALSRFARRRAERTHRSR